MGTIKNEKTQVRRAGSAMKLAAALAVTVMISGCAASITSRNFDATKAGDGIVYKLPVREYSVAVTYELVSCNPVKVSIADVAVNSELVPSTEHTDWFEIDPTTLAQFTSSVDPATIEFNKGMLSTVGLKTTGATTEVLALAKEIGLSLAAASGTVPVCTEAAVKKVTELDNLKKSIKGRADDLKKAEQQLIETPTRGAERRVKLIETRLAEARIAYAKTRDSALRKSIVYRISPKGPVPATNVTARHCDGPAEEELSEWFSNFAAAADELKKSFEACLFARDVRTDGVEAGRPSAEKPFPGVYYRRPATAVIVVEVATGGGAPEFRVLDATQAIPQLGKLQRVEMKGTAFGSRNVSVAFDENGEIKKYELTSKGMAAALSGSLKEIDAAFAKPEKPSELEKLTDEVNLLKKKKELIDAKAALEAAESGSDQP